MKIQKDKMKVRWNMGMLIKQIALAANRYPRLRRKVMKVISSRLKNVLRFAVESLIFFERIIKPTIDTPPSIASYFHFFLKISNDFRNVDKSFSISCAEYFFTLKCKYIHDFSGEFNIVLIL